MRKILEELYHGNLSVDERTVRAGSKYARALAEVAKIGTTPKLVGTR